MASGESFPYAISETLATSSKRRDLLELAIGYALIMAVIWSPRPFQRPLYISAVLWLLAITVISFDGWRNMGFRLASTLRSLWIVGLALALAAIAIAIATHLDTLNRPGGLVPFIKLYWGYSLWAGVQQFLLQNVFLLRLLRLLPSKTTAVIAATSMFALAHLPNPVLTPLTIIWGLAACFLFLRYRNIYPLAVAHAILGVCIALTIPGPIDHNMRVGLGYIHYHPHHLNQKPPTAAGITTKAPTRHS